MTKAAAAPGCPRRRPVAHWLRIAAAFAAIIAVQAVPAQSLFDEGSFRALTDDAKAFRVGDVLTIQIVEQAVATANADTGTQRNNGVGATLSLNQPHPRSAEADLRIGGDFDGGGRTERAGRLMAQLTVSVIAVLASGDLVVAGEQQLKINDEVQRIGLTGRVRPQDITAANVVPSTRVADADITYVGEGHLADRQKPAWWRQLLDVLGF